MDNLGDWLYIVLLVIASVSSLFSSGKKKRRTSTAFPEEPSKDMQPEQPSPFPKDFWDDIKEISEKKPAKPVKSKRKVRTTTATQQPDLSVEHPSVSHASTVSSVRQKEETAIGAEIMPETTFSDMAELRKAIICAEILNRKY